MSKRLAGATRRMIDARRSAARTPPACPPGWRTGAPDFVGIGVHRGGTTWWFDELSRHPDLVLAPGAHKEVHFFDHLSDRELHPADIAGYHRWFPRPDDGIAGEWTPAYIYDPWSLPLLVQAAPDARFLLMLRDPLDRFHSAVGFRQRRGASHPDAVRDAFQRGLYSHQVARALVHVPPGRLLVLSYEQALADPTTVRAATAEFVGLDPTRFAAPVSIRPVAKRARGRDEVPPTLLAELRERYRADIAQLATLLPDVDFGCWPTAHERMPT